MPRRLERICPDCNKRIHRLCVTSDPEGRARHPLAGTVRKAAREREIIASKGHPRTGAARRLLGNRIAAGMPVDSADWSEATEKAGSRGVAGRIQTQVSYGIGSDSGGV